MRRIPAIVLLAVSLTVPSRAFATTCTVDDGSGATPHVTDAAEDYAGILGGTGSDVPPWGDVYRGATDVRSAWFARTVDGGIARYTANVRVGPLTGTELHATYYVFWTFEGGTPAKARRYVAATITRPAPATAVRYEYGYLDTSVPRPIRTVEGTTTGSPITGEAGTISITIPMDRMGRPRSGDLLGAPLIESGVLIGVPNAIGSVGSADFASEGCSAVAIP